MRKRERARQQDNQVGGSRQARAQPRHADWSRAIDVWVAAAHSFPALGSDDSSSCQSSSGEHGAIEQQYGSHSGECSLTLRHTQWRG
jgi:hypothetical protein